jgi:hypothetical protein
MPIVSISPPTSAKPGSGHAITVVCIECLKENTVDAGTLTLGTSIKDGKDSIALPPCACGSQEFLQRTFDTHPVEAAAGHRKTVNALATLLISQGKIHPHHADVIRKETETPTQVGPLVGDVPDSSLPAVIVKKRGMRKQAAQMAATAAAAAAKIDTSKLDPSDPLFLAVKLFEQGQKVLQVAQARESTPSAAAPPTPPPAAGVVVSGTEGTI